MTARPRLVPLLVLLVLPFLLIGPSTTASPGSAASAPANSREKVAVTGSVERARFHDVRSLSRRFEQRSVTVTYTSGGVPETHTFDGPLLHDVVMAVRPRFDETARNDSLTFAIAVTATDDYRAVVSWGELDPGFGGTEILLATHEDGVPHDRPRLVVPGDVKGGRYVSDVRRVEVRDLSN